MQFAIFAQKKVTKEGKQFYRYLTTLKRKVEGQEQPEEVVMEVKFTEAAGKPDGSLCPMNIVVDKRMATFSSRQEKYTVKVEDEDGNKHDEERVATKNLLWVKAWEEGEEYVDHSMDDFIEE